MDAKDVNELIRLKVSLSNIQFSGSKKLLLKEYNFKFLLLYGSYEGKYLTLKEIANELGEQYNTVRTRLKRLKERYPDVLEAVEKERKRTKEVYLKSDKNKLMVKHILHYTDDLDDQIQEKF